MNPHTCHFSSVQKKTFQQHIIFSHRRSNLFFHNHERLASSVQQIAVKICIYHQLNVEINGNFTLKIKHKYTSFILSKITI